MDFNHIDISCIKQYIFIEGIFITSCVICDCKSNLIFCRSCHFYILHLLNNIAPILMFWVFREIFCFSSSVYIHALTCHA
ncbi:hypothetical protein EXVG_00380 [Emiliania huxleyi virus 202]|nr:hypothetical protein EXVG_00380 [Emiliania huxleyi virus 202]